MNIVISIGNTDNKLTQQEWHDFVYYVNDAINQTCKVHYFGGAPNWEKWQNVCWIGELHSSMDGVLLTNKIKEIREFYNQDSAFMMIGDALFV